jgi:universal stress protein A
MSENPGYRKILCPVDFSPPSRAALEAALAQAKLCDGAITLFHVVQLPIAVPDGLFDARYLADVERAAAESMAEWKQLVERRGVPCAAFKVTGGSWDRIVEEARRGGYDLVVIGTHGRSGFKHAFFGSVAERVVQHAPCPVLVARAKAQES